MHNVMGDTAWRTRRDGYTRTRDDLVLELLSRRERITLQLGEEEVELLELEFARVVCRGVALVVLFNLGAVR